MKAFTHLCLALAAAASPLTTRQNDFAGYLLSTFTDAEPSVHFYLSDNSNPLAFRPANGGRPVLSSNVGRQAVRDCFLAKNDARNSFFLIGTNENIRAADFTWENAVRRGSTSLVIWSSSNLVDWSEPRLAQVDGDTAGMAWAPSAVWDERNQRFDVFWATRLYSPDDPQHQGEAGLDRIRHATTTDFVTFSPAQDYLAPPGTPVIDQEFQALGPAGHFTRFIKNETVNQVYEETTTEGLFGTWTRKSGYVTPSSPEEGPAAFADSRTAGKYYVLLDNYQQYNPFETSDITSGTWAAITPAGFPSGLKHGSVTPLTRSEYDAFSARFPS